MATATAVRANSFFRLKGTNQLVEVVANGKFISARDIVTGKYVTITEQQLVVDWVPIHPAPYEPEAAARLAHFDIFV